MRCELLMLAAMVMSASVMRAGGPVITAVSSDGRVSWSCPTNEVISYTVESASYLGGAWTGAWETLRGIAPTGETMGVTLPVGLAVTTLFCRVSAEVADYVVVDLTDGPSAPNYPVSYLTNVPSGGWTDEYKTTKMVFRHIPAGVFVMGSPDGELGRDPAEIQHQVALTSGFYIGVFEVTQRQWERVMGNWPSYFTNVAYRASRPVEQVGYQDIRGAGAGTNWPASNDVDATSFMGRLRARTGRAFDLPTEAQWEYAGRAGAATALNTGFGLSGTESCTNLDTAGRYWYNGGSGYTQGCDPSGGTAAVGSYAPNAWGVYDIHGNVWEWCLDWHAAYPDDVADPTGAATGSFRVDRGGSWDSSAADARVAFRDYNTPGVTLITLGFRVIMPDGR